MKLCVALDNDQLSKNLKLVESLKELDDIWIKIGLRSFIQDGKKIIEEVKKIAPHFKIFLDLKIHDIPNTMADAAEEIAKLGVDMLNIHASAGIRAMETVIERLDKFENRPLVLAVTALTSFDEDEFHHIYTSKVLEKSLQFAKDSYKAGLDGVVCSVFESRKIKRHTSEDFITLTPGIRPFGEDVNDQKRVGNIYVAKHQMSDFVVIGRPIYQAEEPKTAVQKIIEAINE
jgi:orotidine-5'-phosphate decarboxylase